MACVSITDRDSVKVHLCWITSVEPNITVFMDESQRIVCQMCETENKSGCVWMERLDAIYYMILHISHLYDFACTFKFKYYWGYKNVFSM